MEQPIPIRLPPGLYRNGTAYEAKNRWLDAQLVRFYKNTVRPVGGWVPLFDAVIALTVDTTFFTADSDVLTADADQLLDVSFLGVPRGAHAWRGNDSSRWLAVGTVGTGSTRLWAYSAGVKTEITPAAIVDGSVDGVRDAGNYGEGQYGFGLYGIGSGATELDAPDTWALDNFGEFLVALCTSDGVPTFWDRNIANIAEPIPDAPLGTALVVTPERFLFVLGADADVRLVKWPSQETLDDWTPTDVNSAGELPVQTRGRLIAGRAGKRVTLLWTDTDAHAAIYIGGQFVYTFEKLGDDCGIVGPWAGVMVDDAGYWMDRGHFHVYDGTVRELPCDVIDHVFGDINTAQLAKVFAHHMAEFSEVWWFYPSASQSGTENDRYVIYNYVEGHWSTGRLARAAGVPSGVMEYPILLEPVDGRAFEHERGFDHEGEVPFVETGPLEMGAGERVYDILALIPDEKNLGDVEATFIAAMRPMGAERTYGPFSLTEKTSVRFAARQLRLRLEEVEATDWRVGTNRIEATPAGYR